MHPLRAALRLHASPSRSEGEVFSLPLDAQGGMNEGLDQSTPTALELKATRHRDNRYIQYQSPCPSLQSGAVAQLGERVNGIDEVRGSSPLSSTNTSHAPTSFRRKPEPTAAERPPRTLDPSFGSTLRPNGTEIITQ